MRYAWFFVLSLVVLIGRSQPDSTATSDCLQASQLRYMTFAQLDSVSFAACSPSQMLLIIGAAQYMVADTSYELQDKGEMCYGLISDELQRRKDLDSLDLHAPGLFLLVEQLAARQYHLALDPPSDWEKLIHYIGEGRWGYVAQRFVDRGFHLYLVVALIGVLSFYLRRKLRKPKS